MKRTVKRNAALLIIFAALTAGSLFAFAGTKDAPTPLDSYPARGESQTKEWDDAGSGYFDPDTYKPPVVPEAAGKDDCVSCHEKISPEAVKDHKEGKMAKAGVTCASCHGKHPDIKMPTPDTCAKCHAEKLKQHNEGKHGRYGWKGHEKGGRRLAQYEEMKEVGCGSCHNVAKKCDSCHTRHRFSKEEAKDPAACATCHMGPDHAQMEYYEGSKHGVVYQLDKKGYEDGGRAPTCVTCHMTTGNHDVSQGITIGGASQGKWIGAENSGDKYVKDPNGIAMNAITIEDFKRERAKMVAICSKCHSPRFAEHKLAAADGVKVASDAVAGEAIKIVLGLYKDGILRPMPKDRPSNPFPDATGNQGDDKGLWLTGHQLYEQTSGIEAQFFQLYKFDLVHAWKGSYHFSPDWAHWYGNAPMKLHLAQIADTADMIRRVTELEKKAGVTPPPYVMPAAK